jgi:hypothetical protein
VCSRWRDASSCVCGRTQLTKRKRPYACCKTDTREQINRRYAGMKEYRATKLNGILGVTGGLAILLGFSAERNHSTTPTVKVPGPYPYETPVQVPVPPPVRTHPLCRRLLLFRIPNRRPYPPLLKIVIHEQQMPVGPSRQKPCVRQYSNTMGCEFLWIPGSTSCQCQCIRSKTWNNTRA